MNVIQPHVDIIGAMIAKKTEIKIWILVFWIVVPCSLQTR
jgi:hypothetical protein